MIKIIVAYCAVCLDYHLLTLIEFFPCGHGYCPTCRPNLAINATHQECGICRSVHPAGSATRIYIDVRVVLQGADDTAQENSESAGQDATNTQGAPSIDLSESGSAESDTTLVAGLSLSPVADYVHRGVVLELIRQISRPRDANARMNDLNAQLNSENMHLLDQIEDLERDREGLRRRKIGLEGALIALQNVNSRLRNEKSQLEEARNAALDENRRLQDELRRADDQINELHRENMKVTLDYELLAASHRGLRHERTSNDGSARDDAVHATISALQADKDRLEAERDDLRSELARVNSAVAQYDQANSELRRLRHAGADPLALVSRGTPAPRISVSVSLPAHPPYSYPRGPRPMPSGASRPRQSSTG